MLRDKIVEVIPPRWEDDTAPIVDEIVEVVAKWLECDDVRRTIYRGMMTPGHTTKNVGELLARRVRYGSSLEQHDEFTEGKL